MAKDKTLLTVKFVYFCWFGSAGILLPYLTIHMRQLGLTLEETTIILTILPVSTIIGPPLAGLIADKLGKYQLVLFISLCGAIISAICIQSLPRTRVTDGDYNRMRFVSDKQGVKLKVPRRCRAMCKEELLHVYIKDCKCGGQSFCVMHGIEEREVCMPNMTVSAMLFPNSANCEIAAMRFSDPMGSPLHAVYSKYPCTCQIGLKTNFGLCQLRRIRTLERDNPATFWLYFGLRLVFSMFTSICFALIDASALIITQEASKTTQTDYGNQRLWGIISAGISSPLCGLLIDYFSEDPDYEETTNYAPAFYAYYVFVSITGLLCLFLKTNTCPLNGEFWKNVKILLKSKENWTFFSMILALGTMFGFIENFLFWFLIDLKAPKYLLGLTATIGAFASVPFLCTSEWFVQKFGRITLLIISFFVYSVRFCGYSLLTDPWWCIPFEMLESMTYHLTWVAAATYAAKRAPDLMGTMQGVINTIHYDVGSGTGSIFGGGLMNAFGPRMAFRIMAIASIVSGLFFSLLFYPTRKGEVNNRKPAEPVAHPDGESQQRESIPLSQK